MREARTQRGEEGGLVHVSKMCTATNSHVLQKYFKYDGLVISMKGIRVKHIILWPVSRVFQEIYEFNRRHREDVCQLGAYTTW